MKGVSGVMPARSLHHFGPACEASGVRYRDGGQWVCLRHMDTLANDYVGGGRDAPPHISQP
jgi:hypothetical protein